MHTEYIRYQDFNAIFFTPYTFMDHIRFDLRYLSLDADAYVAQSPVLTLSFSLSLRMCDGECYIWFK